MSKTMVEIINEHTRKTPTLQGNFVCGAKGCDHTYTGGLYPEQIVVIAHIVNRLNAAGFGSKHDAWDEGYTTGNAHNGRRDANPHPVTQ